MKIKAEKAREYLRHLENLTAIAKECGIDTGMGDEHYYGAELYKKLHKIEAKGHRLAEKDCNGELEEDENDESTWWHKKIEKQVQELFNNKLKGLYVNGDPRGYTLKINDFEKHYPSLNMYKDFGGYAILAPEF